MALFGFPKRKVTAVIGVLPPTGDLDIVQRMTEASGYLDLPADRKVRDLTARITDNSRTAVTHFAHFVQEGQQVDDADLKAMNTLLAGAQPVHSTQWTNREEVRAALAELENARLGGGYAALVRETLIGEWLPQVEEKLGEANSALFALSDATPRGLRHLQPHANVAAVAARQTRDALKDLRRRWR